MDQQHAPVLQQNAGQSVPHRDAIMSVFLRELKGIIRHEFMETQTEMLTTELKPLTVDFSKAGVIRY